jgi:hypothetical protein
MGAAARVSLDETTVGEKATAPFTLKINCTFHFEDQLHLSS